MPHCLCDTPLDRKRIWKSKFLYRYRPDGIFRIFFRPDSGPPPPRYICFYSEKRQIHLYRPFFPHGMAFLEKRGGLVPEYVFIFPERTPYAIGSAIVSLYLAQSRIHVQVGSLNRSEKLEKAGTVDFEKHPARKVGTRPRQCGPKVPGRFAFPGARNPRICSISRFGKNFPAIFPGLSSRTPEQTPETATAFSSFLNRLILNRLGSSTAR